MEDDLSRLWLGYQAGFAVVTSEEVAGGTVKLSSYRAVLPLNGVDADVTAYKNAGGTVLTAGSQLASYAPAYVTLANSGVVQVVPTVNGNSAALVIANITSGTAYNASITVIPTGLGLPAGTYHLVTSTGPVPPQSPSNTSNNAGAHLSVQNDGNTVIYSTSGAALWATKHQRPLIPRTVRGRLRQGAALDAIAMTSAAEARGPRRMRDGPNDRKVLSCLRDSGTSSRGATSSTSLSQS